jgi:hypothetical protein
VSWFHLEAPRIFEELSLKFHEFPYGLLAMVREELSGDVNGSQSKPGNYFLIAEF